MIRLSVIRLLLRLLVVPAFTQVNQAQGIPVVGGGSLSYVRPSSPVVCGRYAGQIYNFYGYVYSLNGIAYGTNTGGTFWRSLNCATLKADPPETATFAVPGLQGGACTIAFTIFNASQTSAVLTCPKVTATPVISPSAGAYPAAQTVTITDPTPGATIYVTTDGSAPTQQSARYTGPFTVSSSETVRALAVSSGYTPSPLISAIYSINLSPVATPVISPSSGTISSPQVVAISDATPGSTIYVTFDGSTPTTTGTVYKSRLTVTGPETIKAIAIAPGLANSAVATASFTTDGAGVVTPTASPSSTFTNQPVMVTFTVLLGNDPTLQPGSVYLARSNADGTLGTSVGAMYDDGTHGDAKAGDGIYTVQESLSGRTEKPIYFRVSSTHAGSFVPILSKVVSFDVVRPLTDAEALAIIAVPQAAGKYLRGLISSGQSQTQAQSATLAWLRQQPDVYQAGGSDSGGIWYLLNSGIAGGVLTTSDQIRGGWSSVTGQSKRALIESPLIAEYSGATSSSTSDTPSSKILNPKAIVLDPFEFQADESSEIVRDLQHSCFSVATGNSIRNVAANVATFKTIGSYGAISIVSHGDTWYGGLTWSEDKFPLLRHKDNANIVGPEPTEPMEPKGVIVTGQPITPDDGRLPKDERAQYAKDLKAMNLVIVSSDDGKRFAYGITPSFVTDALSNHEGNRIVYVGACRSYFTPGIPSPVFPANPGQTPGVPNQTMAQAFIGKGPVYSGSYFGYTEYVSPEFAAQQGKSLFSRLQDFGTTTAAAFAPLAKMPDSHLKYAETGQTGLAQLAMYGDRNLTLTPVPDQKAHFTFQQGLPGNMDILIDCVPYSFAALKAGDTRELDFASLGSGGTHRISVSTISGSARFTITLPPGLVFDNGQSTMSDTFFSFYNNQTYTFHVSSGLQTASRLQ